MSNNLTLTHLKYGTRRSLAGVLGLLLTLGLLLALAFPGPVQASSAPKIPDLFYGYVYINGSLATTGTVYLKLGVDQTAHTGGTVYDSSAIAANGGYGWDFDFYAPGASTGVSGASEDDPVDLFVNSTWAATYYWTEGGYQQADLYVTQVTYTLTVTSSGCCPISISGDASGSLVAGASQTYTVNEGASVTLTAQVPDCCGFTGWSINSAAADLTNPLTITVNANTTAVAACTTLGPYNLQVTSTGCCPITVTYGQTTATVGAGLTQTFSLACGTVVSLTASADSQCCSFTQWTLDSAVVSGNPISVTMNAAHQVVATCQTLKPYTITASANPAEGGTVTGGGSYGCNSTATLQAYPNTGWEFDNWTGGLSGTDNPQSFVVTSSLSAVANFRQVIANPVDGAVMAFTLNEGWNTFSTPIQLDAVMDTWGEFIALCGLEVEVVYGYDAELQIWVEMDASKYIVTLDGYYIKLSSAGTAQIVPSSDQSTLPVKTLVKGLNLVGVASMVDINVVTYLTTVYDVSDGDGYILVHNPPINGAGDWTNYIYLRDGSPAPTAQIGVAYWVLMLNPGDLYGFTSTPLP